MQPSLPLVLASGSPRRKELLQQLGYSFSICVPNIEESQLAHEDALQYVTRLAKQKAQAGLELVTSSPAVMTNAIVTNTVATHVVTTNTVVLGADTIVVCDNHVLEKPKDQADAIRMLTMLSGRKHQVMTAVSVINSKIKQQTQVVISNVSFKELTTDDIEQYWLTGEPCDKAGSYGIQGIGGRFVTHLEGSYHAVVGLPLHETDELLRAFL